MFGERPYQSQKYKEKRIPPKGRPKIICFVQPESIRTERITAGKTGFPNRLRMNTKHHSQNFCREVCHLLQRSFAFTAEKFPNFTCEVVSKDASILPSGLQRLCFLILVRTFHLRFFGNEIHHLSKHSPRKKSKVFVLTGRYIRKIL